MDLSLTQLSFHSELLVEPIVLSFALPFAKGVVYVIALDLQRDEVTCPRDVGSHFTRHVRTNLTYMPSFDLFEIVPYFQAKTGGTERWCDLPVTYAEV